MSRRNPLAAIEARQRAEEAQRHMQVTSAENSKMKMMGRWEQNTAKRVEATEYYRTMDKIQARQDDVLVARRERLAAMLLEEKERHDAMIAGLAETDEQRRDRLMQQAREMRAQREIHRRGQSDLKMAQLALEKSAAVRMATSNLKILQVSDARHQQLEELQQRRARQAEEDRFFSEQAMEGQRAQNARARQDLEQRHQLARETQRDLGIQVQGNTIRRGQAAERQKAEDAEFFRLLAEEREAEAAKQEMRRNKRVALANEMREHNEVLKTVREEEYARLKAEDKALLDDIIREMAEVEAKEKEDKARRRAEAVAHMRKVEEQMNEAAENETYIDKLWQEENDRDWAKREAKWLADQERREKLLRAVYETRRQQVRDIRSAEADAAEAKRAEHDEMVSTIHRMRAEDMALAKSRRDEHVKTQSYLAEQIATRDRARQTAHENWKTELTDDQRYEKLMEKQINDEIDRLNSARPDRYKSVPLHRQKRGLAGLENL